MADFVPSKIVADIVGVVGGPAQEKFDGNLTELSVAVGHRKKDANGEYVDNGTTWVTVKANGEYGTALKQFDKGDRVRVKGATLETRQYNKKDGTPGIGVDARFGEVELLEAKGEKASAESPW